MTAPDVLEDETLALFERSLDQFLAERVTPEARKRWSAQGHVDRTFWAEFGAVGFLGASVPEEYGGAGGDFRHEVTVIRKLIEYRASGFAAPLHSAVVAPYIAKYAREEKRREWLPKAVSGEMVLAIAMSEPSAGSDLQAITTTATREGNSYRIDGQKTFISNGLVADLVIVTCKTNRQAGSKGISLIAVETATADGFERGRLLDKLGQGARDTAELFFRDVLVPGENLIGEEGRGFAMLMENLPQERMVIAWQALAMMEKALADTIGYVKERRAFGKAIGEFQNTQFKLAECKTRATVTRVFLEHCTRLLLAGGLDTATASMAKLWATEAQGKIVDECLQLFGGYGYMNEYPIAEMYRDARAFRLYGGTSEIMKVIIARSL